jgi:hypothetical protein
MDSRGTAVAHRRSPIELDDGILFIENDWIGQGKNILKGIPLDFQISQSLNSLCQARILYPNIIRDNL